MVLGNIHSRLLTLQTIRPWAKNADNYSSACANGAFTLMERKFAPARRSPAVPRRARKADAAASRRGPRTNLKNPPRIFTEIAIDQLPGIISFFQHDVPRAFADAHDPALKQNSRRPTPPSSPRCNDYLDGSRPTCSRAPTATSASAPTPFPKKLHYDEMVDIPLPKLLEIGYADMHQNQQHFAEVANELEPSKTPREVLEELGSQHPAPDQLLNSFTATFN